MEKKKGYPLTIAPSNGDTTTIPAVMMAGEVEEIKRVSYEDLFINYPANLMNFPLEFVNIQQHQQQQPDIANNNRYQEQVFYETTLKIITRRDCFTYTSLTNNTINWYHHILGHAGQERLYKSISQHMYCPGLPKRVSPYVCCFISCQQYKNARVGPPYQSPMYTPTVQSLI